MTASISKEIPTQAHAKLQEANKGPKPNGTAISRLEEFGKTLKAKVSSLVDSFFPTAPKMDLESFLKTAAPVRAIILTNLSSRDLDAFEIALGKGTNLNAIAFQSVKKQIAQIKQNRNEKLLQEILADHPDWKVTVEAWKDVSLEDKIWLLQLYELRNLDLTVEIPQLGGHIIPSTKTPDLLKPESKQAIIKELSEVDRIICTNQKKFPQAIYLLVNLDSLWVNDGELSTSPDVSRFPKLVYLDLSNNKLTTPPNVSKNIHLTNLRLDSNQLTTCPDVSKNIKLDTLHLGHNQLTSPPDVRNNAKLNQLYIGFNKLTTPPNVSKNVKLHRLYLDDNQLKDPPDISNNYDLDRLYLCKNQLKIPPKFSLKTHPYLGRVELKNNPLTKEALEALTKLKKETDQRLSLSF